VDLRPEWQQLADELIKKWKSQGERIPEKVIWSGEKAYTSSCFCKKAKNYIQNKAGSRSRKKVHLDLFRKYDQWYIRANSLSQALEDIYFAVNIKPDMVETCQ